MRKLTHQQILKRLTSQHPEYDYSLIPLHVTAKDRLQVICPLHGIFSPSYHDHIYHNSKCPECARIGKSKSKDIFIKEAQEGHGTKYDYSQVTYVNNSTKVTITCPNHGPFEQTPYSHTNYGNGCPICGADKRRKPKKVFINEANKVHNNRYNYDDVDYINTHAPVIITCPNHGPFRQRPTNHLTRKSGCPKCANHVKYNEQYFRTYPDEGNVVGWIYVVRMRHEGETFLKIGITKHKNPNYRFEQSPDTGYSVELVNSQRMKMIDAFLMEQKILKEMEFVKHQPLNSFSGQTECLIDAHQVLVQLNRYFRSKKWL